MNSLQDEFARVEDLDPDTVDVVLQILEDVEPVLELCKRIQRAVDELKIGKGWDLENFDRVSFPIYCEHATIEMARLTDAIEVAGGAS